MEVERINESGVLAGVGARALLDLRIGVVEQDPLGLEPGKVPPAVAPPSSTFPPSLAVRALGKLWRGVGEVLFVLLLPGVSVRGRRVKPT